MLFWFLKTASLLLKRRCRSSLCLQLFLIALSLLFSAPIAKHNKYASVAAKEAILVPFRSHRMHLTCRKSSAAGFCLFSKRQTSSPFLYHLENFSLLKRVSGGPLRSLHHLLLFRKFPSTVPKLPNASSTGFFCRKNRNMAAKVCKSTSQSISLPAKPTKSLEDLQFDNSCLRCLPVDQAKENYLRLVKGACFSKVETTPVLNPQLVSASPSGLALLELGESESTRQDFVNCFAGNQKLEGMQPAAHCYCGHQFGNFAGQLGDGAAAYLGEVINSIGERWEIQLKGGGKTPYSREGDGRKVLRSSIREFLCSEHMHALHVPTTRAVSIITSDTYVHRDINYTGDIISERSSIVCRVAPSFFRFGSFEIYKSIDPRTSVSGPSSGRLDILISLTNFIIRNYYSHLLKNYVETHLDDTPLDISIGLKEWEETGAIEWFPIPIYISFFEEIAIRTATLIAKWQCLGWCHGVMNTDNMSILGLTIDYGPFSFMEYFDPHFIPNSTDKEGRYRYANQPNIGRWNLERLFELFASILNDEVLEKLFKIFDVTFKDAYMKLMTQKLGLFGDWTSSDEKLVESLLDVMENTGADWTNTFRLLTKVDISAIHITASEPFNGVITAIRRSCAQPKQLSDLLSVGMDFQTMMMLRQLQSQPKLMELIGFSPETLRVYEKKRQNSAKWKHTTEEEKLAEDTELWNTWLTRYYYRLMEDFGASNFASREEYQLKRVESMNLVNPKVILRNHLVQKSIELAELGDYSEVNRLLEVMTRPYDENHLAEDCQPHPPNKGPITLS